MIELLEKLSHTPIAQQATTLIASATPGTVTLIKSDTGSGKSLVTPLVLADTLCGGVLCLVPSVDTAQDNARRLCEITGWSLGHEIGLSAGGIHRLGSIITIATYGAFLQSPRLMGYPWLAIVLDESHVEQWQVEVARDQIYSFLENGAELVVFELSATMNTERLEQYWMHVASVTAHVIEAPASSLRSLIECSDDIDVIVMRELAAGARLIMVVRPGMREVEVTAENLSNVCGSLAPVTIYHGESAAEDRTVALAPLVEREQRVLVCTPRLLTGFNHEGLDVVITDGTAKYLDLTDSDAEILRPGDMSQMELVQAMGRVGRFGVPGKLILASDLRFSERDEAPKAEVERISSLTLCLTLCELGRDPRTIRFSNPPRDIEGSMRRLRMWNFIGEDGSITKDGQTALRLDIRLDLAHMLIRTFEGTENPMTRALAILTAAAAEAGGMEHPNDRNKLPVFTTQSDWINEAMRLALAFRTEKDKLAESGFRTRAVRRARGTIRRLLKAIDDQALTELFGFSKAEDASSDADAEEKTQATHKTWRAVGRRFETAVHIPSALKRAILLTMQDRAYIVSVYRGRMYGGHIYGTEDSISLGNESVVDPREDDIIFARVKMIVPRNGNEPFPILTECTVATVDEANEVLPSGRLESFEWDEDPGNPEAWYGTMIRYVEHELEEDMAA